MAASAFQVGTNVAQRVVCATQCSNLFGWNRMFQARLRCSVRARTSLYQFSVPLLPKPQHRKSGPCGPLRSRPADGLVRFRPGGPVDAHFGAIAPKMTISRRFTCEASNKLPLTQHLEYRPPLTDIFRTTGNSSILVSKRGPLQGGCPHFFARNATYSSPYQADRGFYTQTLSQRLSPVLASQLTLKSL